MRNVTPESVGVHSAAVEEYLRVLCRNHLCTHDVLIARGNDLLLETYVKPFHRDFLHREYSVTKSFVALAVGFAEEDGLLSLDDPIEKYFAKEMEHQSDKNMRAQTIRQMMMMSTAKTAQNWFAAKPEDRVQFYFDNDTPSRPAGSYFEYDSSGTFVVGALIERLTGQNIVDYLREKMLDKIGVSKEAKMLFCPGGHSWSDSAFLMKPIDLMLSARFVLNGGAWDGEQILNREFVKDATSKLIGNDEGTGAVNEQGYGYYFWKTWGEGFFFNGMGCQFAVCVPEKDLILVYNGDNQGNETAIHTVIGKFFELVVNDAGERLPEDEKAFKSLQDYADNMVLTYAWGENKNPLLDRIDGKTFVCKDNPMGITSFTLRFEGDKGIFTYKNQQGDKAFAFGLGHNEFGSFPQAGYSDTVGTRPGKRLYGCAASGAWRSDHELWIKVQLIDDYFGNFDATFIFTDDFSVVKLKMEKTAEDFLNEYQGTAIGLIGK